MRNLVLILITLFSGPLLAQFALQKSEVNATGGTLENGTFSTSFSVGSSTSGVLQDAGNTYKTIIGFSQIIPIPSITSFSPTSGPIGTSVTINGTNLTGATAVSFGGTAATSFNVVSSTSITALVSTGTSGNVSVTTAYGTAILAGFTFIPAPTISSFTPTSGVVGTEVLITGGNFDATSSNNTVEFNGTAATVSSASTTSLTVAVPTGATIGVITITVGGLTATSATNFVVVPTITNTTYPDNYDSGTEPTTSITFDNVADINQVNLMYKGVSEDSESWEPESATGDGNTFSATIAANDMIGTEFYFRIMYGTALELLSDSGISYINYPSTSSTQNIPSLSFGDQVSNYQIIAVPLELDNSSVTTVFSSLMPYDKTLWRLYDYANGDNREYSGFTTIDVGKGYWLIVRNSTTINPGAGQAAQVSQTSPFNMTLAPGWNLIGNPYNFRISWQEVLDYNGNYPEIGDLKTFSGGVLNTSTTLDKYRGGFVFNDGNAGIAIDIPVLRNESLGGRIEDETKPSDLSEKYWELTLNLSQGELQNRLGGIGMHPEATLIGKDQFDEVSVPMIKGMGFFELGFEHPEYNAWFNKEVIPTTDSYIWELDVSRDVDEPLSLNWDNENFGDNDYQLILFNPATLEVMDMRSENNYQVGVGIKNLRILFGNKEYINEQLDTSIPLFGEPYPNPTSYQIKYPIRIPKGDVETVSFKVYDNTGKMLGQSIKDYQPGIYQLDWQFEHSGLYVLQLQIGDNIRAKKIIVR